MARTCMIPRMDHGVNSSELQRWRTYLQVKLAMAVPDDAGGETGGRGALAGGVHGDGRCLGRKLEELRLGRGRISQQEHIDVPAPPCAVRQLLQANDTLMSKALLHFTSSAEGFQAGGHAMAAACGG